MSETVYNFDSSGAEAALESLRKADLIVARDPRTDAEQLLDGDCSLAAGIPLGAGPYEIRKVVINCCGEQQIDKAKASIAAAKGSRHGAGQSGITPALSTLS